MAERRDDRLTPKEFQQAGGTEDWRFLALGASAWFAAPSHAAGAQLVRRVAAIAASLGHLPAVDLRATGVHVRTFSPDVRGPSERDVVVARAVSSAARELGLAADPTAVQAVNLTIDTLDRRAVMPFWAATLAYEQVGDNDLVDPLGRHPGLWFQQMDAPRPLRSRVHLDVGVPHEVAAARVTAAEAAGGRVRYVGPEWRTLADPEGNEADVLPLTDGDPFTGAGGVEDWRVMLDAGVWYPAPYEQGAELCAAVARLADDVGVGLLVDLRPSGVAVSTGKDRWATPPYRALARGVQQAARALGLAADLAPVRDLQLTIDAVDVPAVQDFWVAALGYARAHDADPRASEADLYDPHRLSPPLCFQQMDPDDDARRAQRNRIHVDVFVPDDQAEARIAAALGAGGRIVYDAEAPEWWTIADPEGNEVDIAVSVGREELWAAQQHDGAVLG